MILINFFNQKTNNKILFFGSVFLTISFFTDFCFCATTKENILKRGSRRAKKISKASASQSGELGQQIVLNPLLNNASQNKISRKEFQDSIIEKNSFVLNEIRAIISGPQGTSLVLTLDIRPTLEGKFRTLRDIVLEHLMVFDVQKLHMEVSDDDVDRMVRQLQKNNNMTESQLVDLAKTLGYSFEEFRAQIRQRQYVERALDFRVRGALLVTEADVQDRWAQMNQRQEATYTLSIAFVKTEKSIDDFKKDLEVGKLDTGIVWGKSFTLAESELVQDKKFIVSKRVGEIVDIEKTSDGLELTKLISKTEEHEVPLRTGDVEQDKIRYAHLESSIKQDRFKVTLDEYEKTLLKGARIEFTYPEDKIEIFGE